jgi:hypothetical protein
MHRSTSIAIAIAYAALIGAVTWGMWYARDVVAPQLDTEKGQHDWDEWRHEASEQAAGKGPVTRREPKSFEPPLVVLMRDYFAVCLGGAIVFSSLLFAVFGFVIRGIISTPKRPHNQDTEP